MQPGNISNNGERLIPGYSHDLAEVVRTKSSYQFFHKIIESDRKDGAEPVSVLEIGCGCGHGTFMLKDIPHVHIYAIDIDHEAFEYARNNFSAPNITYVEQKLHQVPESLKFDYILSRGSFEHIPNIFEDILSFPAPEKRLITCVPYKEKPGNPFHLYLNLDEATFEKFGNTEFFYEDMQGYIYIYITLSLILI